MIMKRLAVLAALFLVAGCAASPLPIETRAANWWTDVEAMSNDGMEGRAAGSPGYDRAALYIADRFAALGLEPAGTEGYFQPVGLEERRILLDRSSSALVADGRATPLAMPNDIYFRVRGAPPPERIEGRLVFIGYGLHIPEAGHDDFANVDLRGAVAVVISGGPANISGALKSHARDQRTRLLVERGAVGLIAISTVRQSEAPWERTAPVYSTQPGMYFADLAARDPGPLLSGAVSPAAAERLFARSGHSYNEIAAAADASRPVVGFALNQSLRASITLDGRSLTSPNIVGRLRGSDPSLAAEHVVLTAHLDGLGIGTQTGDAIHNGTLDNAAGVASLLDIAARYRRAHTRPRRSILFVALTGEERGLLGSRYFARRPSVPRQSIVANLNYDMALPLFPLTSVTVLGAEESSLGADARAVGEARGLPLAPDPFPNRNSFVRSDQYSFIEEGIPALAFKFGFAPNTPEAAIEAQWRANRYHMPSDDLAQPVQREDSVRLNDFIADLALRVANARERPRWNDNSFFRRFARPQERTP